MQSVAEQKPRLVRSHARQPAPSAREERRATSERDVALVALTPPPLTARGAAWIWRHRLTRVPSCTMVLADGIVVRASPVVGGGKGLFATAAIAAGAMVWREDPDAEPQYTSTPRSAAWVAALPAGAQRAYRHFMCVVAATAAQPSRPLRAGEEGRVRLAAGRSRGAAPSTTQVQNGRGRVSELA